MNIKLSDIDLDECGQFLDEPAGFVVTQRHLGRCWDYWYVNQRLRARVGHDGSMFIQVAPPDGTVLTRSERLDLTPPIILWMQEEGKPAFNYSIAGPQNTAGVSGVSESFSVTFRPNSAEFCIEHDGWKVLTSFTLADDSEGISAAIWRVHITNKCSKSRRLRVMPVCRPHLGSASLAPWDLLETYQFASAIGGEYPVVALETRDPDGIPERRRHAAFLTDLPAAWADVSLTRFCGMGDFSRPQVFASEGGSHCSVDLSRHVGVGHLWERDNTSVCNHPVAAVEAELDFKNGDTEEFSFALSFDTQKQVLKQGWAAFIKRSSTLMQSAFFEESKKTLQSVFDSYRAGFSMQSPDAAFDGYVNDWLPIQLRWISELDRGWPSGMRGTRDAAQDYSGVARYFPEKALDMLLRILACQRKSDGWFPRQFSEMGPEGTHDMRDYVDSGCWVFELFEDCLWRCNGLDIMKLPVRWLESEIESTVRDHIFRLLDYYLLEENQGPHGLVKIRGGDWNDAVNCAGLEGRGESVMSSAHVLHLLQRAIQIFPESEPRQVLWQSHAVRLRKNLRKHALNPTGFLNGVFTDGGEWVFSDKDSDGEMRVNGAVNAFGVIAGVFEPQEMPTLLRHFESLEGPNGWRLFHPPLGATPIKFLGRLGHGDMAAGMCENGTVYNHGSQGFPARALARMGEGDALLKLLKWCMPYDQSLHPIGRCLTAPYAMVNYWRESLGREGEGGTHFLSGVVSTCLRVVLDDMLGFRPGADGLRIEPVLPTEWGQVRYQLRFRGAQFEILISKEEGRLKRELRLDGTSISDGVINYDQIIPGQSYKLELTLSN